MIDFHSHILPDMDDGSDSIQMSLGMLRMSFLRGVDTIVVTPHFYADEEYPCDFFERRKNSFEALLEAMFAEPEVFPHVIPGAEVLYFPGIGNAEDIAAFKIAGSDAILIEPPMIPWQDSMLDDIASLRDTCSCTPVIAHVDRFMDYLDDEALIDRVLERKMLVQVNAEYFINTKSQRKAFQNLKKGKIHLLGSDCHNLTSRAPNLSAARQTARLHHLSAEFNQLTQNAAQLLGLEGILP